MSHRLSLDEMRFLVSDGSIPLPVSTPRKKAKKSKKRTVWNVTKEQVNTIKKQKKKILKNNPRVSNNQIVKQIKEQWRQKRDLDGEQFYSDSQLNRVIPQVLAGTLVGRAVPSTLNFESEGESSEESREELDEQDNQNNEPQIKETPKKDAPKKETLKVEIKKEIKKEPPKEGTTSEENNFSIKQIQGNDVYNIRRVEIGGDHTPRILFLFVPNFKMLNEEAPHTNYLETMIEITQVYKPRDCKSIYEWLTENQLVEERYKYELEKKISKSDLNDQIVQKVSIPLPFMIRNVSAQVDIIEAKNFFVYQIKDLEEETQTVKESRSKFNDF